MQIDLIAGARPNIMKVAPLYHRIHERHEFSLRLVHTGQHYDYEMSQAFFDDFQLPAPDLFLDARGDTHAEQTARIMQAYERYCQSEPADLVIVVGDVNSTAACAITAKKCNLTVAHLEAGLRAGDRSMPEEINRILTDSISDYLWTHSSDADQNLLREGHPSDRIQRVGNIMIDAYEMVVDKIAQSEFVAKLGLRARSYAVATFHRPANVDDPTRLPRLVEALLRAAALVPIVFPAHPRTRKVLDTNGFSQRLAQGGVILLEPLGYIDFMALLRGCAVAITDSGGIQEETSYLGIPCLTIREHTERPITIRFGTNRLVAVEVLPAAVAERLDAGHPPRPAIPLWDGHTADRIVDRLVSLNF
jgi:UDP-N-acetylglucosamine 2-epimerase (non-hydrolysing)